MFCSVSTLARFANQDFTGSTRFRFAKASHCESTTFNSEKLKVNDLRGNPVEIGTVVVWRVSNTAQAAFDVQDYESYVEVQTESALRTIAAKHPYDAATDGQTSLRGDSDVINDELQAELTKRLSMAGIEVIEVRISHLAYAPEIAGAMLRRQQAPKQSSTPGLASWKARSPWSKWLCNNSKKATSLK